jgi:hypothetical protein
MTNGNDNGRIVMPGRDVPQTDGGIYVPGGTGQPELSAENRRIIDLKKRLDFNSLESALTDCYLSRAKYTDANGVVRYHTELPEDKKPEMIGGIMDALRYHLNYRHFEGFKPEMAEALNGVRGPNGISYNDTMLEAVLRINQRGIERMFKDTPISRDAVEKLGQSIGQDYLKRNLMEAMEQEFGEEPERIKSGVKNLNSVYNLIPRLTDERLSSLRTEDLTRQYIQMVGTVWNRE